MAYYLTITCGLRRFYCLCLGYCILLHLLLVGCGVGFWPQDCVHNANALMVLRPLLSCMDMLAKNYIHWQHWQHVPEHTSWLGPGSQCSDELLREFMADWPLGLLDSQWGRAVDTGPAPEEEEMVSNWQRCLKQGFWWSHCPVLCWILLILLVCVARLRQHFQPVASLVYYKSTHFLSLALWNRQSLLLTYHMGLTPYQYSSHLCLPNYPTMCSPVPNTTFIYGLAYVYWESRTQSALPTDHLYRHHQRTVFKMLKK